MLKLTVSQDGSGDFASISEAVLAVPYELEAEICIGPGIYREKPVRAVPWGRPLPPMWMPKRPCSAG